MPLKLMLITNDPEGARFACAEGVDRIFVDLELIGKKERQGHLDTVISGHVMDDVGRVRPEVPAGRLLVRLNPLHGGSRMEVDRAIALGADLLMLPMFSSAEELGRFSALVAGRAGIVPLVETPEAVADIEAVARIPGITEIFLGLNDLHLALGLRFMFEPLASGLVEHVAAVAAEAGVAFGFGGIGKIGEGELPAELILGEHLRLGSSSVILSRSFHRGASPADPTQQDAFREQIRKLRETEARLARRSHESIEEDREMAQSLIAAIAARKKA